MGRKSFGLVVFIIGLASLAILHGKIWIEKSQIAQNNADRARSFEFEREITARFGPRSPPTIHPPPPDFKFNAQENYWVYWPPTLGLTVVGLLIFLLSETRAKPPRQKNSKEELLDTVVEAMNEDHLIDCCDD